MTFRGRRMNHLKLGDNVRVQVTGTVRIFEAEVIGFDAHNYPMVRVSSDGILKGIILKDGDYIIVSPEDKKIS